MLIETGWAVGLELSRMSTAWLERDELWRQCAILNFMNDRSFQDILEWVVLGLLIAVAALVVLWVGGWLFTFLGAILKELAGFVWALLRVLVPALIVVAVIYFVVRFVQKPKAA